jgi:hypothetical protein
MSDGKLRRVRPEITPVETHAAEPAVDAPAAEPIRTIAPEAAAIPEPPPEIAAAMTEPMPPPAIAAASAAADDSWIAVADAQAAMARGFAEFAAEVTGLTRTGAVAGADAALALLGARTFAEIVEINAGLACRGMDAAIAGSARLSEIGLKTMADSSKPLLARFGAA